MNYVAIAPDYRLKAFGVIDAIKQLATPFAASLFFLTMSHASLAADPWADKDARRLQTKAMEDDYLATDFDKARARLQQAIVLCGPNRCRPELRGELHRDLGVVLIVGLGERESGRALLVEALKIDPTLKLDPDVKTKELEVVWSEAKAVAAPTVRPSAPRPFAQAEQDECPPGLPGCRASSRSATLSNGAACNENAQCGSGRCRDHRCEASATSAPRWWVGASFSADWTLMPRALDVCRLGSDAKPMSSSGYTCTAGGSDYPTRTSDDQNSRLVDGKSGGIAGTGLGFGSMRVMVSGDYAVTGNLLLGARLGYVFNRHESKAAFSFPVHLEARVTWLFGKAPLFSSGFAPYIFISGGASEFVGKVPGGNIHSTERDPNGGGSILRPIDIWAVGGPGFVSAGGGVRWAPTARIACTLGPKVTLPFGYGSWLVLSPEIGLQYGF